MLGLGYPQGPLHHLSGEKILHVHLSEVFLGDVAYETPLPVRVDTASHVSLQLPEGLLFVATTNSPGTQLVLQFLLSFGDVDVVADGDKQKDEGILGSQEFIMSANKVVYLVRSLLDP